MMAVGLGKLTITENQILPNQNYPIRNQIRKHNNLNGYILRYC